MSAEYIHEFGLGPNAVSQGLAATRAFVTAEELGDQGDVLAIIVEELLFNLIDHGDAPPGDPIALRLARVAEGIRLVLESGGTPFDPREAQADRPMPERGGGAGLALVRVWARIEASESSGGRNRLQLLIPPGM